MIELIIRLGTLSQVLSNEKFAPVERFVFDKLPFYEENSVSFDSIAGYRWNESGVTVQKQAMEATVFENTFRGNNYGMHSKREYLPKKQHPNIKRWIVFGDSFTDAYFLRNNWVDVVDSLFRQSADSTELYSFSINGGGIKNWYQIYNQLVYPNFEFDGVVFAVFGNDLDRDFFVMNQIGKKTLQKYYDTIPNYFTVSVDTKSISTNDNQKVLIFDHYQYLYISRFYNYLYRRYLEIKYYFSYKKSTKDLMTRYIHPIKSEINEEYFKTKYGEKYFLIVDLLEKISQSGKTIILVSIPEEYGLSLNGKGKATAIQSELIWLSQKYNTKYIDGYKLLLKSTNTDSQFISFDGHWTQATSDSFAIQVYKNYSSLFKDIKQINQHLHVE
ncbi:MAG: hypothetical protein M9887_11515 [Chitinophagales bacterium]|nr:hypothetical protein [Chitinophagales bacterium]